MHLTQLNGVFLDTNVTEEAPVSYLVENIMCYLLHQL
jgi:hypothetical protein